VECNPSGDRRTLTAPCVRADVRAYPTWMIDGQKHEGVISIERLAELSSFRYATPAGVKP
jgi:hypothetical protein